MPVQQFSWMGPSKTTSSVLETGMMRMTSETGGLVTRRVPKSNKDKRAIIIAEAKRVLRSLNSDEDESDVEENGQQGFCNDSGAASSEGNQSSSFAWKWRALRAKLPIGKEEKDRRDALFNQFDPNGNGYLSLAEVDRGARDLLSLHTLTNGLAPILMRAHTKAKSAATQHGDKAVDNADYVQKFEFRWLLIYIYNFFELWSAFDAMDVDKDRRVSLNEFRNAVPLIESWGVKVGDVEKTFASIDRNGGGQVLFEEFCDWAFVSQVDVDGEAPPQ